MAAPALLLVGLGNPGPEYASTRHNVGFMALDAVASGVNAKIWQRKYKGLLATAEHENTPFLLLKPMTFMNLSGEAVGEAVRFYKLSPEQVIVIHDDIDLLSGKIKIKQGGGNAGHNGLKSIEAHIGNAFWRVRLGVGRPEGKGEVYDHVLGAFAKGDQIWLAPMLEVFEKQFPLLLNGRFDAFMSACSKK